MLSLSKPLSAASAEKYYDRDNYYLESSGQWYGKLSTEMGVAGEIEKSDFKKLLRGYYEKSRIPKTSSIEKGPGITDIKLTLAKPVVTVQFNRYKHRLFQKDLKNRLENEIKLVKSAGAEDIKNPDGTIVKYGHRSGIDMTFSAPKSVSILSYKDKKIEQCFQKVLKETLDFVEKEYSVQRIKTRTKENPEGKITTEKTGNMLFSTFTHRTSRELDPQLHAHCVMFNLTKSKNGEIKTISNDAVFKNRNFIGQYFRNQLAKEIKTLGYDVEVTDRKKGFFEIKGIEKEVIDAFSKRREQVTAKVSELRKLRIRDLPEEKLQKWASDRINIPASDKNYHAALSEEIKRLKTQNGFVYEKYSDAQLAEMATLDSRTSKKNVQEKDILNLIDKTCSEHSTSLNTLYEDAIAQGLGAEKKAVHYSEVIEKVKMAVSDLTEGQSGFQKTDVLNLALKYGLGDFTLADIETAYDKLVKKGDIVFLGKSEEGREEIELYSSRDMIAIEKQVIELCKKGNGSCKINVEEKSTRQFIENTDITLKMNVSLSLKEEKFEKALKEFNHPELHPILHNLREESEEHKKNSDGDFQLPEEVLEQNPELRDFFEKNGYGFTPGQKDALGQITSTKCQFSVIQGDAGTGKSFSMMYARELLEKKGFKVKGFAPTGKAADELAESAKIGECGTIDSFLLQYKNADIDKRAKMFDKNNEVWVVDESGMCGSKKILELMRAAKFAGAKVVFVGDRKQFASIEAGRMFSELQDKAGIDMVIMPDVMRQKTQQTKDIVKAISLKDIDFAFATMKGQKHNTEQDFSKPENFHAGQVINFVGMTHGIRPETEAKVLEVGENDLQIEFFDEETRRMETIKFDPSRDPGSFRVFDADDASTYKNVFDEIADRRTRLEKVAEDYLTNTANGTSTMVITAVNSDRNELNEIIRDQLLEKQKVKNEGAFKVLESNSVSGEAARLADSYKEGQILVANNTIDEIKRGTQCKIQATDIHNNSLTVEYTDKESKKLVSKNISLYDHAKKICTFNEYEKDFGAGEKIVFLKNDKKIGVRNGQLGEIESIDKEGNVVAKVGRKQVSFNIAGKGSKAYRNIDYSYALSEYKSQGATVKRLCWHADSTKNVSSNSFYVAITRCKEEVAVYTDDIDALKEKVKQEQQKISTLDYDTEKSKKIKKFQFSNLFLVNQTLSYISTQTKNYVDNAKQSIIDTFQKFENKVHTVTSSISDDFDSIIHMKQTKDKNVDHNL